MHLQYNQQQKNNHSNPNLLFADNSVVDDEVNRVAVELDLLARSFFREGVRGGILAHHEDEIRQDAILLALNWFTKGNKPASANDESPVRPWNTTHAIAAALKFTKLRYYKRLSKEAERRGGFDEARVGSCNHYFDLKPREWPEATVRELIRQAIHSAVKSSRVSQANGCIALHVFHHEEPVNQVAKRRRVHRTAIYQRLSPVRRELTDVVGTIEMPVLW